MLHTISFHASLLGREVGERKASNGHVLLYGAIEVHSLGEKGCIASNATLAKDTGLSERTVKDYLNDIRLGGWVEYTLDERNYRGAISPMLQIVSPLDDKRRRPPTTGVVKDSTTGVVSEITVKRDNRKENSSATAEGVDVNKVIEAFKVVNPSYATLYPRIPQRKAAERLLKVMDRDMLLNTIAFLSRSNSDRYAPTITTPIQLEENLGKLQAWAAKKKEEKKQVDLSRFI